MPLTMMIALYLCEDIFLKDLALLSAKAARCLGLESETPNLAGGLHHPKTRRIATLCHAERADGGNGTRSHMLRHPNEALSSSP